MAFAKLRLPTKNKYTAFAVSLCLMAGGCAHYAPPTVDPKTGLYGTSTEVDKSGVREFETNVNPRTFRFVVLKATSNVYAERFEFFVRNSLADLGLKTVLNQQELVAFVKSHPKFKDLTATEDPLAIKKISDTVGPILMIDFSSTWDGDARRYVALKITDASTGKVLLRVDHPKLIWASVDPEAHYPVLNVMRNWFKESTTKKPT